jgi:preprotein translocase subunit SecY
MNRYLKSFLQRGIAFGGFGPLITGIVFAILELSLPEFSLGGIEVLLAIVSSYLLAFIQAGSSVFNQIEEWPVAKSSAIHFLTLFVAYTLCYIVNRWIPFEPLVLLIFAAVFTVSYAIVYLVVMLCVKHTAKRLNDKLKK